MKLRKGSEGGNVTLMEVKGKQVSLSDTTESGPKVGFIRGIKEELSKITWTTKIELIFFTKLVVITTFTFGLGIYLFDLVIKGVLEGLTLLLHRIFG